MSNGFDAHYGADGSYTGYTDANGMHYGANGLYAGYTDKYGRHYGENGFYTEYTNKTVVKQNIHESALNYFIEHQEELCEKYNGKELLMRGAHIVGAFDTLHEAAEEGRKLFGAKNFSVQKCIPGEEAYTVYIQPEVIA